MTSDLHNRVVEDLLRFAMHLVRPAARTELVQFEPFRMLPLVLGGAVGALFALGTGQRDNYACFICHRYLPYSRIGSRAAAQNEARWPHGSMPHCGKSSKRSGTRGSRLPERFDYSKIFVTTPAPTVLPPSRIAKRRPSSMAIGWISVPTIRMLSPGMTISTPSGRSRAPVTSVVRK